MRPFDLVIFDCDGVLVDSERITNAVFAQLLAEIGLELTMEEMFEHFVGRTDAECMREVARRLGRPPPAGFAGALRQRAAEALRRDVRPVPGVEAALDAISLPVCVASSGAREKMELTLGVTGLLPRFRGRLFSATEVDRGKPAPDVFLHAARSLGVVPGRTAVVEDSPVGVTAGVAAGMRVFGFAAATAPERLCSRGACVFRDMAELPALLRAHGAPGPVSS
jgi:HAD superfamily hydrolase (TIGR01509 family)